MSKGWHGGTSSSAFVRQSWSNVSIPFRDFFLLPDFETCEELYYPDVPLLWQEQQEKAQANNDNGDHPDTVEDNFTRVVINNCVGHWTAVITWDKALGQYPYPSPLPPQLWRLASAGEHGHGGNCGRDTTLAADLAHNRVWPPSEQAELARGLSMQKALTPGAAVIVCSGIFSLAHRQHRNSHWGPGTQRKVISLPSTETPSC